VRRPLPRAAGASRLIRAAERRSTGDRTLARVSDFEKTYGSSVNARMATHAGEGPSEPVDDVERTAAMGEPPVPGAQWDELHRRWEHWDEAAQAWMIVGDPGDGVAPEDENTMAPTLARDLLHADDMEVGHESVPDVTRAAEPTEGPPGAQWNEVKGRWDRWDDAAGVWVAAEGA
jgi:hypothetical protein